MYGPGLLKDAGGPTTAAVAAAISASSGKVAQE